MATALILGATSDIGVAIAKKFASENFDVILAARKPEQLKPLESDIQIRYRVKCNSYAFDVLKYDTHSGFFFSLHSIHEVSVCFFGSE
jgi:short-subunit dehydrogenase